MASTVEQIKEKLSIVDVVGSYVQLEKSGTNFKGKCPFHNEKTASFFVSPARNSYYCFGCGAKGDVLSFVQQFEGLDFIGALRVLAKRAGVEIERENPEVRTERERLYLLMEHATLFFQKKLGENISARDYLKKRGITAETARSWRLGYAPLDWRVLTPYLISKGFKGEEIEKSGLAKKPDNTKTPTGSGQNASAYDRFRGRIMFPIFDSSGRVVAFSGRQFESDGTEAKYINSPETELFHKSHILYGFDRAKLEIRRQDFALLVEGQMDLVMSHQAGMTNTVASSGTALTAEQLEILKRLSKNLIIAYDGDSAGSAAAARGWQLALAAGMEVKIAVFPEGKDPADLVVENPAAYTEAVKNAQHIIDVELARIIKQGGDERAMSKEIGQKLLPYIADIDSGLEQAHFIKKITDTTGIKEALLQQEVKKIKKHDPIAPPSVLQIGQTIQQSRKDAITRLIWGLIFWQERATDKIADVVDIRARLCKIVGEAELKTEEAAILPIAEELIFEAEVSFERSNDLNRHIDELILNLEEEFVREQLSTAMKELRQAERLKDSARVLLLLQQCQDLSAKLRSFNQRNT